ncbi:hypothetical protein O9992_20295 [Vibrio lentus]|nr:hypothetical protein [Vibrio lentus]
MSLTIAYVDDVTGPVFQVSNAQLNDLYLQTVTDFSVAVRTNCYFAVSRETLMVVQGGFLMWRMEWLVRDRDGGRLCSRC